MRPPQQLRRRRLKYIVLQVHAYARQRALQQHELAFTQIYFYVGMNLSPAAYQYKHNGEKHTN